jgi:quercetin dioxygenase-like cupin family protein
MVDPRPKFEVAVRAMAGTRIDPEGLPWETREDPPPATGIRTRWRLIFSRPRTPGTSAMCMGLAEFPPGAVLPLHHHAPAEIYHVLDGEGLTEVEGEPHRLRPGVSLFIPANARHRTTNTGARPLRFLFMFPTDSFEERPLMKRLADREQVW